MEQKTVAIDIKVNSKEAIKTLGDLEKETEKFNEELKKTSQGGAAIDNVEKAFNDLNKKVESGEMSMRDYTKAIKQYQTIALQAGETSPIGADAIQKAAALRDRLGDLNTAINTNAHDGKNMQAALQLGSSVTAGYGVAQGAMALLGEENEDLMKSMVKLQAATSVLTGLEQIRASLEKESFMMQKAKTIQTYALATATGVYSAVVGTTTGALKILRIALISTGIGAIVVAIGLLIANFDIVTEYVKKAYKAFSDLGTGVKIVLSIMFPFIGLIWGIVKALEAMGIIDDEVTSQAKKNAAAKIKAAEDNAAAARKQAAEITEAANKEIAAIDSVVKALDFELAVRQAGGEDIKELERQRIDLILERVRVEKEALAESIKIYEQNLAMLDNEMNAIQKKFSIEYQTNQHLLKLKQTQQAENVKLEEKAILDDAIFKAKEVKAEKDALAAKEQARKAASAKKKEDNQKIADEEKKKAEDAAKEEAKRITEQLLKERQLREEFRLRNLDDEELALEKRKLQLDKELEIAGNNLELQKILKDEYQLEILSIEEKYAELRDKLAAEEADKQKQRDKEALDNKIANIDAVDARATQGIDFLTNLNALFGKNSEKQAKREFQINKARDLAGAVTNTAKGVTQALASAPPPISFVNAGIVGAIGGLNIARIAKAKFGDTSGGGSVSLPSTSSGVGGADVGTVSNTTTTIGGSSQVFVTEQDITNTQGRVRVLENQATF
jgi:hypothetical protein